MTLEEAKVIRIIEETQTWLDEHGYHPSVAQIQLEAMVLRNKALFIEVLKEVFKCKGGRQ